MRQKLRQIHHPSPLPWRLIVFTSFVVITVWTAWHHEPWRDEAQAWLIARDLPLGGILKQMGYEGSPALWHLLLFPLAQLGLPYFTLKILNLSIVYGIVTLVLYRSPFTPITKIVFVFSHYLAWEYAIIARSYGLTILLLFGIASLYKKRFEQPIIYVILLGLLVNTNVHSLMLSMSLGGTFLIEVGWERLKRSKFLIAMTIIGLSILGAIAQMLPPEDSFYHASRPLEIKSLVIAFNEAFIPHSSEDFIIVALVLIALLMLHLLSHRQYSLLTIMLTSYLWLGYIFAVKHGGGHRHYGLILTIFIFTLWVSLDLARNKESRSLQAPPFYFPEFLAQQQKNFQPVTVWLLTGCLFASVFSAHEWHYLEHKQVFSGSKSMANYLKQNPNLLAQDIVAYPSPEASAILPYFPQKQFWYADIQAKGSYMDWTEHWGQNRHLAFDAILQRINDCQCFSAPPLLLLNQPVPDAHRADYRLRYASAGGDPKMENGERFYLYQLKD